MKKLLYAGFIILAVLIMCGSVYATDLPPIAQVSTIPDGTPGVQITPAPDVVIDIDTDDDVIDIDAEIEVDIITDDDYIDADIEIDIDDTNVIVGDENVVQDSDTEVDIDTGDGATIGVNTSTTQVNGNDNTVTTEQEIKYIYETKYKYIDNSIDTDNWYTRLTVKEIECNECHDSDCNMGECTENECINGGCYSGDGEDTGNTSVSDDADINNTNGEAAKEKIKTATLYAGPSKVKSSVYELPKTGVKDPSTWMTIGVLLLMIGVVWYMWRKKTVSNN